MHADPFVQAPYNSQSYNRYSYVFNNPLSFTDPTGYSAEDTKLDFAIKQVEETEPTIGQRSECTSGRSCLTGDDAYYLLAYTNSSNLTGFANGVFYDPNYVGQGILFTLIKEGIAQANADLKNAMSQTDSTSTNGNLLSQIGLWVGAGGGALEKSRGYIGIHRTNSFDWRFYKNGWTGSGYVNTHRLANAGRAAGVAGTLIGIAADTNKLANARTPKQVHDAKVSLVLNTTLGVAAMKFPKLGLPGFAKGITDEYGPQIMGGAMQLLIDGQKDSNAYIRVPNNDLDKAWDQVCVSCKK